MCLVFFFFFQAEDGIRDLTVTGVQTCALPISVASLTVLDRHNELRAHIHAALNVGATRQEVAEVIFQQVTYGGMPVVVEALDVYAKVLGERGEPFPAEETAAR